MKTGNEEIPDDTQELEDDELLKGTIGRKKTGRRTNKGTYHGKSQGKHRDKDY